MYCRLMWLSLILMTYLVSEQLAMVVKLLEMLVVCRICVSLKSLAKACYFILFYSADSNEKSHAKL